MFLAYRDGVGLHSTVVLDSKFTPIKDLPAGHYDLFHNNSRIYEKLELNKIPGTLLYYCAELEKKKFQFRGNNVYDMISNLEITVKQHIN